MSLDADSLACLGGARPPERPSAAVSAAQKKRYSPVTVEGVLRVGHGSFYLFDLAARLGRGFRPGQGFANGSGSYIGVEVGPKTRDTVLDLARVSRKRWDNVSAEWVKGRIAHRCGRGTIVLFPAPLDEPRAVCPRCQIPLESRSAGHGWPVMRDETSRERGESTVQNPASTSDDGLVTRGYKGLQRSGEEGDVSRPPKAEGDGESTSGLLHPLATGVHLAPRPVTWPEILNAFSLRRHDDAARMCRELGDPVLADLALSAKLDARSWRRFRDLAQLRRVPELIAGGGDSKGEEPL